MAYFIAVDLGAESGRVILGALSDSALELTELHRFPNIPVAVGKTLHWDILRLWHEIQAGVAKATGLGHKIEGLAMDTWGVDFGLMAGDGSLLGNPVCYRDARTVGMPGKVFAKLAKERIYAATGIQTMPLNTLFQLAAMREADSPLLKAADKLLFIPDLLSYWFTGTMANEYTFASTSQMLDARKRAWSGEILGHLGIPAGLFPKIIFPGRADSRWGTVRAEVGDALGATGIPVLAVGSHDTASAVAAIPATTGDDWLFLSSGTWSLLGVEVREPVLTAKAAEYDLTNEGGLDGTIRLLKNIAGLWLVQECKRAWAREGKEYDYTTLTKMAEAAPAHFAAIDPADGAFASPGEMPRKIAEACRRTGQRVPDSPGVMVRVILESLAATYAKVMGMLQEVTGRKFGHLHIVGGGSQNDLLNQLAADATGLVVHAGPVEATALGNIVSQAVTTGHLGSLAAGRELIARTARVREFRPRGA